MKDLTRRLGIERLKDVWRHLQAQMLIQSPVLPRQRPRADTCPPHSTLSSTIKVLSPQNEGALPKRSAIDLVASFTPNADLALSRNQRLTMVTIDVLGAVDALLVNRLLHRMRARGWDQKVISITRSILSEKHIQVRYRQRLSEHLQGSPSPPGYQHVLSR